MSAAMRFVLLDDTERQIVGRVLEDAAREGHQDLVDLWTVQQVPAGEVLVHGLADAG